MKDKVLEEIAGFMDGELPRDRGRFALRRLSQDSELTAQWQRMHMVRSYLRDSDACPVPDNFLEGIQEHLSDQPMLLDDDAGRTGFNLKRWARPLISTAVAASVAVLALVGVNQNMLEQQNTQGQPAELVALNSAATTESEQDFVARSSILEQQFSAPVVPVNFTNDPQATRQRLNDYLLRHNQLSGSGGRFGFVSYMPLVSGEIVHDSADAAQTTAGLGVVETQVVPATAMQDSSNQ